MASLGELVARMSLDYGQFTGALNKIEQQVADSTRKIQKEFGKINESMTALVVGFVSIHEAAEQFNRAVERAAGLDEMSKAFGTSVEELDQLTLAMKLAGTDAGTFEKQMKSLGEQMTLATNPASKQADVFAAMGVAVTDAAGALRPMGDVYKDLIKQLSAIEEPALRAAAAQQLFGRGAVAALKAAEEYDGVMAKATKQLELFGATSEDTAAMAKEFKDQQELLSDAMSRVMLPVVKALLPAFGDFTKAMSAGKEGGKSLAETLGGAVATTFRVVATGAIMLVGGLQRVGIILAGLAAAATALVSGGFGAMKEALNASGEDLKANSVNTIKAANAMLGLTTATAETGETAARTATDADKLRKSLNGAAEAAAKANKELAGEAAKDANWVQSLAEAFDDGDIDTKMQKFDADMARINRSLTEGGTDAETAGKAMQYLSDQMFSGAKAAEYLANMVDEDSKALDDYWKGLIQHGQEMDRQTDAMGDQLAVMGLEGTARELALSQLQREHELNEVLAHDDEAAKVVDRQRINDVYDRRDAMISLTGATRDYQDSVKQLSQTMESGLVTAFDTLLEKGKSGFKDLWDNFKSWAFKAMAEVAARKVVVALGGTVAAGSANAFESILGGQGGSVSSSGGGLMSSVGSLFGGLTGGNQMGPPTASQQAWGDAMSTGGTVLAGAGAGYAIGGVAASTLGNDRNQEGIQMGATIGAAIGTMILPGIGTIVGALIGSLAGSLIKSGGGAKAGGFAQTGSDVTGRYFTPNDTDESVKKLVDSTADTYKTLVKALGGTSTARFALGYDTDPAGTAGNRVSVGVYGASGNELFSQRDVGAGKDDAGLQAGIEKETKRALLSALQQSDLPDSIAKILDTVIAATGSSDAIDSVLTLAGEFKNLLDIADAMKDPMQGAADALAEANKTGLQTWQDQRTAFDDLLDTVEPTAAGLDQLTQAAGGLYQSTIQLLSGMMQAKDGMSKMFADTRESIERAVLNPQQLYERIRKQTQSLYDQLTVATDPADIARLSDQINKNINEAFGMLTPEQQASSAGEFLARLDDVDKMASDRMDLAMQGVEEQSTADQLRLSDALDKILASITGAGTDFKEGADVVSKAAGAGFTVKVQVQDDRVIAAEVSG